MTGLSEIIRSLGQRPRAVTLFGAPDGYDAVAIGSLAAGLLYTEETDTRAVLLFVAALLGAVGCIFFFYCCLRQISSKPKGPYISTLR